MQERRTREVSCVWRSPGAEARGSACISTELVLEEKPDLSTVAPCTCQISVVVIRAANIFFGAISEVGLEEICVEFSRAVLDVRLS